MATKNAKNTLNININDALAFDAQEWLNLSEEEQKAYLLMRQKNNETLSKIIEGEVSDAEEEILNLALRANAEGVLFNVTIRTNLDNGRRTIVVGRKTLALINQAIYGIFVAKNRASEFRAITKTQISEYLMPDKFALVERVAKAHPEMFLMREETAEKPKARII